MAPLETLEFGPLTGPATEAVIWMHGLGADATDFEPVVPHLHRPRCRFVFPNAPIRPVTLNFGRRMRAWYDLRTLERVPGREDAEHIAQSAAAIDALIEREVARGLGHERIALAGFSQGAVMALYTGLLHPHRLAGILVLSGALVLEGRWLDRTPAANAATPIFFGHGERDPTVPLSAGRAAWEAVREGRPTTFRTYPMGHGLAPAEIAHIRVWLTEILG